MKFSNSTTKVPQIPLNSTWTPPPSALSNWWSTLIVLAVICQCFLLKLTVITLYTSPVPHKIATYSYTSIPIKNGEDVSVATSITVSCTPAPSPLNCHIIPLLARIKYPAFPGHLHPIIPLVSEAEVSRESTCPE